MGSLRIINGLLSGLRQHSRGHEKSRVCLDKDAPRVFRVYDKSNPLYYAALHHKVKFPHRGSGGGKMGSCEVCEPLPTCGCLVLFVDGMLLPDPLPWVEFQTMVLVNELLALVDGGNFAPRS